VELLHAAQASLREWSVAHHEALAVAGALGELALMLDLELDPKWVDTSRKFQQEREQQRAERETQRKTRVARARVRRKLHVLRDPPPGTIR
jgi:hypothetical protein